MGTNIVQLADLQIAKDDNTCSLFIWINVQETFSIKLFLFTAWRLERPLDMEVLLCSLFQLNRVKLVEKEKNSLEGEKNKAVEFLKLENDIFTHKSRLYQYYVWVIQHNPIL